MIYCYAPQFQAVQALLRATGLRVRRSIQRVDGSQQLAGLTEETFIEVDGHPAPIPQPIRETLAVYGFLTIVLSDRHMRDREHNRRDNHEG